MRLKMYWSLLSVGHEEWVDAFALREYALACALLLEKTIPTSHDLHRTVAKNASQYGFAPPQPLLFADTNWSNHYFGFIVNPGTHRLELWRLDFTGLKGQPMSAWNSYLDGTSRLPWVIYTRPYEYRAR